MSLRDHFVWDPPSAEIAARLNAENALLRPHGLDPCTLRCGVKQDPPVRHGGEERHWEGGILYTKVIVLKGGPWVVEPLAERVAWLECVEALIARDAARELLR